MSWKKLKPYSNFMWIFLFFSLYSNPSFGQELDTIVIDLAVLSEQDSIMDFHYNIPKSKCKKGSLLIPIRLENHDTSMVFLVHKFKGNGYVKRENSTAIVIDPKDKVFHKNWVLYELLLSNDCSKNRKVQSLSIEYHNAFYNPKKESKNDFKNFRIIYKYID